jgi:hypothetical protein
MMTRPRIPIGARDIARARQLRAAGASWKHIGARLGYHGNTLRERLDREFAAAQRLRYMEPDAFIFTDEERITPEEAARAIATVPIDTRTVAARFLGDPLPGRSALDRKRLGTQRRFLIPPRLPEARGDGGKQ